MITITDSEFRLIAEYIKENYGIHLKNEKKNFVIGRLGNVLTQMGFLNFTEYYKYLMEDQTQEAATLLLDKITTNHTFFMRESDHFYFLRDHVLPQLKKNIRDNDLRVWCAASSTGEEPYTLAMIIHEFSKNNGLLWDKKVLATDIDMNVLETAQEGVYATEKIDSLPKYWRLSYFEKYDTMNYRIKKELRDEVIFRRFNLMEHTFPFRKKFHVIFCRNVMIYFENNTKEELIQKFSNLLVKGGYLFIGHSEALSRDMEDFEYMRPSVYRKIN